MTLTCVYADTAWTHKNVEGQGGGVAADYVFYKTNAQLRAIFAYDYPQEHIIVADYALTGWASDISVKIMKAKPDDINKLSEGKDVEFKIVRDYKLDLDKKRGFMTVLKDNKNLTTEQQNDIVNLIALLSLQRIPMPKQTK